MEKNTWRNIEHAEPFSYLCGYCGKDIAPSQRYMANNKAYIFICPKCTQPTFFDINGVQTPKPSLGRNVAGISKEDVAILYREARDCTSVGAYNATVMVCRKILMNLAVQHKADENKNFAYYVDFLIDNGYVPPKGKEWVDAIRKRGNEANHEISLMNLKDAQLILHFTEALLRFNYELPHLFENDNKLE